jgi:hypothetical protein
LLLPSDYDPAYSLALLANFSRTVPELKKFPEEIKWDMLSAQAFITSVQTTTGEFKVEDDKLEQKVIFQI